jgi:DNA-binding beta-propeller fold protein YncE
MSLVAGTGQAGNSGDGGPAVAAQLYYPYSIALDDTGRRLFVADSYNHRIREVDLLTGVISTLAGTGTAGSAGDDGPAIQAELHTPLVVAQRGGKLYVSTSGPIRVIDLTATPPAIHLAVPVNPSCAGELNLYNGCSSGGYGCGLAVDAAGALYLSGYVCGTATESYGVSGIARWDGITLTHVAGRYQSGSNDSDGAPASLSYFVYPPGLAFGPGGRLFVADVGGHRIRWIDLSGASPVNRRWFGASTSGYAGNYVSTVDDPFGIELSYPSSVAFTPAGHAVVVDYYNHAVRLVWKAASALP